MENILFALGRNLVLRLAIIIFGLSLGSCATQIDIPALTAQAKTTLAEMDADQRPDFHSKQGRVQPEDITEGVIHDHISIIDFLVERNKLREKSLAPTMPVFSGTAGSRQSFPQVVFFYKGRYKIEQDPDRPPYVDERCSEECIKILFEGHADTVINAKIDPHSLEFVPASVREFRKTGDCAKSFSDPDYIGTLPALGLCIEMRIPENGTASLERDGLYVYGDYEHVISPFTPKEFWIDSSKLLRMEHMMDARRRTIHVMKDLKHVFAQGTSGTDHRAIRIRSDGKADQLYMLFDYTCVSVEPELPESVVHTLITSRAGEDYLNSSDREGDKLYFSEGEAICQGRNHSASKGLFENSANGRLDFPSLFTPQEIEQRLTATLHAAKAKGEEAKEWQALRAAMKSLQWHHPDFDQEIASRMAPILIETAKRDFDTHKILERMPHKSMEPYMDDLIWIIEDTLSSLGCEGLNCAEELSSSKLFSLAEIFNGAGPQAAEYLAILDQANHDMYDRLGYGAARIGGIDKAIACIHNTEDCPR